jgi:hypothetical protein
MDIGVYLTIELTWSGTLIFPLEAELLIVLIGVIIAFGSPNYAIEASGDEQCWHSSSPPHTDVE